AIVTKKRCVKIPEKITEFLVVELSNHLFLQEQFAFDYDYKEYMPIRSNKLAKNITILFLPRSIHTISSAAFSQDCDDCFEVDNIINYFPENKINDTNYLAWVEVDERNNVFKSINGVLYDKYLTKLLFVPFITDISYEQIPKSIRFIGDFAVGFNKLISHFIIPTSIKGIGNFAFYNCMELVTVILPPSLEIIESYAFANCVKITDIKFPTSLVKIGHSAFENTGITKIVFPQDSKIRNISNSFSGCSNLESIHLPEGFLSVEIDTFNLCNSLKRIYIPKTVNTIQLGEFFFKQYLEQINVSSDNPFFYSEDGVLFDANHKTLLRYPSGKSNRTYEVPSGTETIFWKAFEGCNKLFSITLPSSLKRINDFAFFNCIKLRDVKIQPGLKKIGLRAFVSCLKLKRIFIPKSVTNIGELAFFEL
ncbi:MAG: leucine-rich repeat domain-containing protein, partial [bacterium]|nr:leucine-rich repeat domain-containing protein [bacterium]